MEITFVGKKPNKKVFEYSVVGNAKVDRIDFILTTTPSDIYSLSELADFLPFVKVQSVGLDYVDKIKTTSEIIDDNLVVSFTLQKKTTQFRNIAVQLQFENDEGRIIAQCEMVGLALSGNINADHEIPDKYPSVLVNLEYRISRLEQGITADTYSQEEIDEFLSHKQDTLTFDNEPTPNSENVVKSGGVYQAILDNKTIVFGDPNDYLNESGLDKIIRPIDSNGNVDKSYVITKTYYPSTLVESYVFTYENNVLINSPDMFIQTLGDNSYEVLGENAFCNDFEGNYTLFYNVGGVITKGIVFTPFNTENDYGYIELTDCEPNKKITIVVGKYFEYDQQGNKVFDEHCVLFSDYFADESLGETQEITEERQEFELETDGGGRLYFDSDGNDLDFGGTRFILYEIKAGEEEHTEYNAKEIGSGGGGGGTTLKHPTFIRTKLNDNGIINDCVVMVNSNHFKTSKLTQQRWVNSSKGNKVIRDYVLYHTNIGEEKITNYDLMYNLLGVSPLESNSAPYISNPKFRDILLKKPYFKAYFYEYDFRDLRDNGTQVGKYIGKLLDKKYMNKIMKHGYNATFIVSIKIKLRFVRNFEWKVADRNDRGWKGEMNANEMEMLIYLFKYKINTTEYERVFLTPKWKSL